MKSLNLNIRDFFFSNNCIFCCEKSEKKYRYLCHKCYRRLERKISLRKSGNFYYIFDYDRDIKKLIGFFKLQNRRYISQILGDLTGKYLKEIIKYEKIDIVVPVPINIKRKRERGFNQVEDILEYLKIPYESVKRIKNTRPMHQLLDEDLRKENIKNSFESSLKVHGKIILVIDDIVTTGSTIRELTKILKSCGEPKKILVFSLAAAKTAVNNKVSF
ncbi:ComF family protein [uncultured Ilyobacter sp.]|uniref:ComF family protein n=1 Tax=uncultured Ilyobacter sp. TaxID=544433 RepID=UPI0029C00706|nr:ComF family protein [uncultured Ilyobacter sp.]